MADNNEDRWFRVDAGYTGSEGTKTDYVLQQVYKVLKLFETKMGGNTGLFQGERTVTPIAGTDDFKIQQTFALKIKKELRDQIVKTINETLANDPLLEGTSGYQVFNAGLANVAHYKENYIKSPQALKQLQESVKGRNAKLNVNPSGEVSIDVLGPVGDFSWSPATGGSIIASQLREAALPIERKVRQEQATKAEEEERANAYRGRKAYGKQIDLFQRNLRSSEQEDIKKQLKQEEEKEKSRKQLFSGVTKMLTTLTALTASILHVVNKLYTAATERAREEVANARSARNMGMDPATTTKYGYLALSKGLDKNIFNNVFADVQERFGDVTALQADKLPASFDIVVGSKLAKLFTGGITGENSEEFVKTILDAYLARFQSGIGTTGEAMSDDRLRVNLYNSLKQFSPELADIFTSMLDSQVGSFSQYKESYTDLGYTSADARALERLGKAANELSSVFEQFKDNVFANFSEEFRNLISWMESIIKKWNKDTGADDITLAYQANTATKAQLGKDINASRNVLDAMLRGASVDGNIISGWGEYVALHGGSELTALGELSGITPGSTPSANPTVRLAAIAMHTQMMKNVEAASALSDPDNTRIVVYDDSTIRDAVKERAQSSLIKLPSYLDVEDKVGLHSSDFGKASALFDLSEDMLTRLPSWYHEGDAATTADEFFDKYKGVFTRGNMPNLKEVQDMLLSGQISQSAYNDYRLYRGNVDVGYNPIQTYLMMQGYTNAIEQQRAYKASFNGALPEDRLMNDSVQRAWSNQYLLGASNEKIDGLIDALTNSKGDVNLTVNNILDGETISSKTVQFKPSEAGSTSEWMNQIMNNSDLQQ